MRILIAVQVFFYFGLFASCTSIPQRYSSNFLQETHQNALDSGIKVTFLGASSLLFDDGDTQLLIDGFFSRPNTRSVIFSKLMPDKKRVNKVLKEADITRLRAIFVAHTHYDHALDAAYISRVTGAHLYGSASAMNIARGSGVGMMFRHEYIPEKPLRLNRFTVTAIPSQHSPPFPAINSDLGETIDFPLLLPAHKSAFKEGGSYDLLIEHDGKSALIKPSAGIVNHPAIETTANVLFLSVGTLAFRTKEFKHAYYDQTVGAVAPQLVIPIHWDNFFRPLSGQLRSLLPFGLEVGYIHQRLAKENIEFCILQGFQSIHLFGEQSIERAEMDHCQRDDVSRVGFSVASGGH